METKKTMYKIVERNGGNVEFIGTYFECRIYFNKVGWGLSIFEEEDDLWDEDGNSNAILSN